MNKELILKELRRLQRDLNSRRLGTYMLGDTSEEEQARVKEREVKVKRFNEILLMLNKNPLTTLTNVDAHT